MQDPGLSNPSDSSCNKIKPTHSKIIHPGEMQKENKGRERVLIMFTIYLYLYSPFNKQQELDPILLFSIRYAAASCIPDIRLKYN